MRNTQNKELDTRVLAILEYEIVHKMKDPKKVYHSLKRYFKNNALLMQLFEKTYATYTGGKK